MSRIGIVSGTSIERSEMLDSWKVETVETKFGPITVKRYKDLVAVNRHGFENPLPPHAANYRGNAAALLMLDVAEVVCLSSVGSLREEIKPGTLVSCSDYVSFAPMTAIDDRMSGFAPVIGNALLGPIRESCPFPIVSEKLYMQTRGPRFETKAEVRILRSMGGDVVGMTFANEADLLLENGIGVTSLCMPDNYAHGLGKRELDLGSFRAQVAENQEKIDALLRSLIVRLGG